MSKSLLEASAIVDVTMILTAFLETTPSTVSTFLESTHNSHQPAQSTYSPSSSTLAVGNENNLTSASKAVTQGTFLDPSKAQNRPSQPTFHIELEEQAVPTKRTKVLQSKPVKQSTPISKSASNPEGSKADGKKTAEDSIGGPEYSEIKSAAKPTMITRSSKDKISLDKPANPSTSKPNEPSEQAISKEPPLPPLPPSTSAETDRREAPKTAAATEPPVVLNADESVATQGTVINDRTVHQEAQDHDVAMPDAPPVPSARETTTQDTAHELAQVQLNLPPPPPRNGHEVTNSNNPNERHQWLLPPLQPNLKGKKCLVLDLDETLVHSSFKMLHQADFTIPVEIEGQLHNVYVIKRPGVDQFMKRIGELYEVVVFTASVSKYGDPLLDQLDIHKVVHHRLFRESCYHHQGNYVKDLSQVGRELKEIIIIDNSPTSYIFHPQHAVPISSWFSDAHDNELLDLIPVLEDLAGGAVRDVSMVLDVSL
ncbi:uncharacterized protein KY384_001611 [Bacidia gigantensis]|uniref:uncharacterized protein n=1 Tax=Bacidia gigantensis TaxID=2732470 RepID=UPI001D044CAE|nr:uncharacterized protein KY384_001611 [Bacidia gigantensis]KAG8533870.1 hypothetical protein KY384_001611 [Bacidia gigantensis]